MINNSTVFRLKKNETELHFLQEEFEDTKRGNQNSYMKSNVNVFKVHFHPCYIPTNTVSNLHETHD
jgi:hypothetical protein